MSDAAHVGMAKLPRWCVMAAVGVLLAASSAAAEPLIRLTEPSNDQLFFDHAIFDAASPTQRIRIRNDGDLEPTLEQVFLYPPFVIVASGGSLAPGQEAFWDIACVPTQPDPNSATFELDWCGSSCDASEDRVFVYAACHAGLLDTPTSNLFMPAVFAYQTSELTIPFTNNTADPVTITGFVSDPAFSVVLATGSLPLTLLPGDSASVDITFDTTGPDTTANVDVLAGSSVVARVVVYGQTLKQIQPTIWSFEAVPLGSVYTVPIAIRNSSPATRTIGSLSSDLADYTITGLVGTTLAPGDTAYGLLTLTASTLGNRTANFTLAFDTGNGDAGRGVATVVDPVFMVTTGDATPDDGRLSFGTHRRDAGPIERTITVTNTLDSPRGVLVCPPPAPPFELLGTCPTSIPAHGSFDVTIRMTPAAAGHFLDAVGVVLAGVGTALTPLDTVILDHQLESSASALAFADQVRGTSQQLAVTLTNSADDPLIIPAVVTGAAFTLVGSSPVTVPAHGSVDVTVEFRPQTAGAYTGTLELGTTSDPDHAIVPLSGTATTPMVTCDASLDLGKVMVGDTGVATLSIHNLDPTRSFRLAQLASDSAEFTAVMPADPTLAPLATLEIEVRFVPTSEGSYDGHLDVILDGDAMPLATVGLHGDAIVPPAGGGGGCCSGAGSPNVAISVIALALMARRRRQAM